MVLLVVTYHWCSLYSCAYGLVVWIKEHSRFILFVLKYCNERGYITNAYSWCVFITITNCDMCLNFSMRYFFPTRNTISDSKLYFIGCWI